jgi:hypothetical protein
MFLFNQKNVSFQPSFGFYLNEKHRGEWGEMAVGQNAQIDFVCYSIALAN